MKSLSGNICYGVSPQLQFATRNNKFEKEKVNFEDENYLIQFDGVLLNSKLLMQEFNCDDNCQVLQRLYESYGSELVFYAKGVYSLVVWDKRKETILITNDLISKRSIYYHIDDDGMCYAGSYHDLLDILSKTEHAPVINLSVFDNMIAHGFICGNETYLDGVYYLDAFESLVVNLKTKTTECVKHSIKIVSISDNEDSLLEKFDLLFSKAIKLQFEKNREYGYRQCVTLSGGMDSRSCFIKGVQLGYKKDMVCFNYAQSGSLDHKISQQIAVDFGVDYLFYPMDAALFLERQNEAMRCNECQQSGVGSTGANTMANLLNTSQFGIVNTGLFGGELLGDLIQTNDKNTLFSKGVELLFGSKRVQKELINDPRKLLDVMRGCQSFSYMFLEACEAVSPYMDEDVVMFVMQLPSKILYNRRFYTKWMTKYLPNKYAVTHTCCPIGASAFRIVLTKMFFIIQNKVLGNSAKEMNPFDYWFSRLPSHMKLYTDTYNDYCDKLGAVKGSEIALEKIKSRCGSNVRQNLNKLTCLQAMIDIYTRFGKLS